MEMVVVVELVMVVLELVRLVVVVGMLGMVVVKRTVLPEFQNVTVSPSYDCAKFC